MATTDEPSERVEDRRERLVRVLSAATFLIFFQAYMLAPLIPRLSAIFGVSDQTVGLAVPAYLIPYGVSTLFYGVLSDRIGRRRILLSSLIAFILLTALSATAQTAGQLIGWRLLTGLGASGVVPLGLALIGKLFPYEQRGRPLGWLFGAMAGGMAFGSTVGVVLEPFVGWRMLFVGVAAMALIVLFLLMPYSDLLDDSAGGVPLSLAEVFNGYRDLLTNPRGARTYAFVLLNSIFHSGVFTWLGVYFAQRYALGEVGIGLALLGYGLPGFLLGPVIGRAADRWGRLWLVPAGLAIGATAAAILIPHVPLIAAALAVTALSLGYDMTQPLLAGIVTALGGKRAGQAMGLNVFALFTGFGVGSLLFGSALRWGFAPAIAVFAAAEAVIALAAVITFRDERANATTRIVTGG